jgi:dihydrofolate reductase
MGVRRTPNLVYAAISSLDGYTADENGNFEWSAPDPEVHGFINDLERGLGTHLYGRRMYETMVWWETFEAAEGVPPEYQEYAEIWRAADKVVYSRTLEVVSSARTRIERSFEPASVRQMKEAARSDLSVGGPELAGQMITAGLVDEIHFFLTPVIVGGGTRALPDRFRSPLALLNVDRFTNGVVHLHYGVGD